MGVYLRGGVLNRGLTVCFICKTLLIFVPTSGQSEMLNNKKYYMKDAPEVSFEWPHLPRPQDFVYVRKS